MGELLLYVFAIGALVTGIVSALVYFKIFFGENQKDPSFFGWVLTCLTMCPVNALIWPFVIKGLINTLKNYDAELRRKKEQKRYQEWVMGLQDNDDYPAPPWINPKTFGPEFVKQWGNYYNNTADTSSTQKFQASITQVNSARLTSEEMRRGSFPQRYATAQKLAQQHKVAQEKKKIKDNRSLVELEPKLSPSRTNISIEVDRVSVDEVSPKDAKQEKINARHAFVQTTLNKPEQLKPFTKSVVCHVCRHVLIVDTLERESTCPNCRQHLIVH
ncbi:hypothetical protein [Zwartia vadi]|uniref:hypothetical protein n=1 Tax=Zwartia vadi TaxID=3058168 RepID=UPI0025B4F4A0|nr:hypothetical protein [Zwartia vadi]MDN3986999.1 hypothetical protein [Zwartia vadi]